MGLRQKGVQPHSFIKFPKIEAPRHLRKVAAQVLLGKPMMGTDDLALEQRPHTLNAVCVVEVVLHVFAERVIDLMVIVVALIS